ncbi:GroES-like protein [Lophiostoma macrostomum CBS 122681]|uniref:GroES-like protein n=1 Tax=Lophiostoma macrostomum CBS 122681 TaxID=1314788 RepID=A0A6A6TB67_9PLEO|nr:GroES-like protein [Lophiostoma macrostomum CBS 122681]
MSPTNTAAWITAAKASPLEVKEAELWTPGPNDVLIKNHAVAINPVDWKIQTTGMFLQKYPMVLGTDVAGEVVDVGENVKKEGKLQKGDRVLGHAFSLMTNAPKDGGFQHYTTCTSLAVSKIPSSLSYTSAAVLPLSLSTAAAVLFKRETLGLALPTSNTSPKPSGKSVLVWGGSSSVGASAIQLAVGAGHTVFSVSSSRNIAAVKELGASEVFDYNSSGVADDIISAIQSSGTEFVGVADCIGTPDAAAAWTPVYKKLGGRYGSVMPEPKGLPEGIEGAFVFAPSVATQDRYVGEAVWEQYVPKALEEGKLKAKPDPIVIKSGLEKVQEGIDKCKQGVSFAKVVVEL